MTRMTWVLTTFVALAGVLAACAAPATMPTDTVPGETQGQAMGPGQGMGVAGNGNMGPGQGMGMAGNGNMGPNQGNAGGWMEMEDDGRMMEEDTMMWGQPVTAPGGMYRNISVEDLQAMMAQKDFLLINVHIPFAGNIPGTDLSIPYNRIAAQAQQLPADKDTPIVVYCRSGAMSTAAARTLVQMGYTRVYNLQGGFNAWQAAGLPLDMNP